MAIVNANNLVIRLAATASDTAYPIIAHLQTASLSFSNSYIDITTKRSNSWMEKISGQRSWSLSGDGLVDFDAASGFVDVVGEGGAGTISALALGGTQVAVQFGIGNEGYKGAGFATFDLSGGTDDAPTYSITIEGTGELEYDSDFTS